MKLSVATLILAIVANSASAENTAPMPIPVREARVGNAFLPAGTEVKLRMAQELTTRGNALQENDTFVMTVAQDVRHQGFVVIPRGSRAVGRVTFLTSKGMFGKSGKMNIEIEYVEVAGRTIKLDGTYRQEGEGNTLATIGGVILVGAFAGFVTGKSARIPMGRELTAIVEEQVELELPSYVQTQAGAPAPTFGGGFNPAFTATPLVASRPVSYQQAVQVVQQAARSYPPNYDLGEGMRVNSFLADGNVLTLNTNVHPNSNPANVGRIICSSPGMRAVLVNGGTVAVSFGSNNLALTQELCGF